MTDQDMDDLTGWQQVPCRVADLIRYGNADRKWPLKPFSSLTDPEGEFGRPIVYTEWGVEFPEGDAALLREYRWPKGERACEHYVPEVGTA